MIRSSHKKQEYEKLDLNITDLTKEWIEYSPKQVGLNPHYKVMNNYLENSRIDVENLSSDITDLADGLLVGQVLNFVKELERGEDNFNMERSILGLRHMPGDTKNPFKQDPNRKNTTCVDYVFFRFLCKKFNVWKVVNKYQMLGFDTTVAYAITDRKIDINEDDFDFETLLKYHNNVNEFSSKTVKEAREEKIDEMSEKVDEHLTMDDDEDSDDELLGNNLHKKLESMDYEELDELNQGWSLT